MNIAHEINEYAKAIWQLFKSITLIEKVIVFTIILIVIAIVTGGINDSKEWQIFVTEHNCKVVSKEVGKSVVTTNYNGSTGTAYIAGKTGWLCDDGVTYYRNN